eukprot:m.19474 g.19474  ORF g.19474 m.19474 type:complete len:99 (-) comp10909_c0_seq4:52-348(-)
MMPKSSTTHTDHAASLGSVMTIGTLLPRWQPNLKMPLFRSESSAKMTVAWAFTQTETALSIHLVVPSCFFSSLHPPPYLFLSAVITLLHIRCSTAGRL